MASAAAPGRPVNEDHAFRAGRLVGVLDGVTAPAGLDTGCAHGPAWYARRLAARLARAVTAAPGGSLAELLAAAIRAVRGDHGGSCDLDHPGTPAATVGLLRWRADAAGPARVGDRAGPWCATHLDYLILCDATLVVEQGGAVRALTDGRFGAAVAEIRRSALAGTAPLGSPAHEARLRAAVAAQRRLTNRPHGYWIAAAEPAAAGHAITGTLPLAGPDRVRRAALLTDGAACAVDGYGVLDWRRLLDVLDRHGPRTLITLVRRVERADHEGRARPRYKRHDDATAVFCAFDGPGHP